VCAGKINRAEAAIDPLILSEAPTGAQSKDLSNSLYEQAAIGLFERSFDSAALRSG
jgi:hypothetical protein